MSRDEIAVLDGGKCILQLRGIRPFLSDKYDLTQHPNYKLTSDYDPKNTFDIDANGIVKVSAKDLGTGKEQNITITASTNMSKDDIDKAVKEAEQFAADDKKKREEVDIRNGADQMVFQTEKMLKENGDKMPADVKSEAEAKLADLKTAVQSGSIDDIKAKQDALSHVFEKMYQAAAAAQQAAGAQPGPDAGAANQQKPNDDGVVDADFKEV